MPSETVFRSIQNYSFAVVLFYSEVPYSERSVILFKSPCSSVVIAILLLLDLDLLRSYFSSGTCQRYGSLNLNCNIQSNNFAVESKLIEL